MGLDMHSVDRVLPEFQSPQVGETIGYGSNTMRVERVESERVLAWRSQDGNWVWTFVLEPGDGSTRLISRNRFRLPTVAARLGMIPMEPASLVMERKMLRGIKERAERLARPPGPLAPLSSRGRVVSALPGGCALPPWRRAVTFAPGSCSPWPIGTTPSSIPMPSTPSRSKAGSRGRRVTTGCSAR